MPEREDRLASALADRVIVLVSLDEPAHRSTKEGERWKPNRRDCRSLGTAAGREEAGRRHIPSYCGPPPPSGGTQSMIW